MPKNWKLLCLVLLLAACKEKNSPIGKLPNTEKEVKTDTVGWGNGAAEIEKPTEATADSVPEIEKVNPGFVEDDVVFSAEGKIEGFEIKHFSPSIKEAGEYEVRLLSSNPDLRFVFRENNLDSEANAAYWKGSLAEGITNLKVFFVADAALGKEKARYRLFIVKL
jgi:hypothetical protein